MELLIIIGICLLGCLVAAGVLFFQWVARELAKTAKDFDEDFR